MLVVRKINNFLPAYKQLNKIKPLIQTTGKEQF